MVEKFLKPPSISKRLAAFKDIWYGIANKVEQLSKYKSGFDDELKNALKEISSDLKKCTNKLETVNPSIKHNLPLICSEIDKRTTAVINAIEEFNRTVERDIENVISLRKFKKRASDIKEAIERMDIEFRDVESRTSELCTRYFERKKEYKREHDIIEEKINAKIDLIRKDFYEKIKPIVEEYEIVFRSEEIEINQLFDIILKNPSFAEGVSLVPKEVKKGFFESIFKKREDMDKGAKETVLNYVSKEIVSDVKPITALKTQALVKLDTKFADLRGLERACNDAEKKRKEITTPRQGLLDELSNLRKSDVFSYENHNKILSIREEYLKIFNEKSPALKEFFSFVTKSFEGYEYEPDVEKRELKSQIKKLESTIKTLEEENKKVNEFKKEKDALKEKLDKVNSDSEAFKKNFKTEFAKLEKSSLGLKEKLDAIKEEYYKDRMASRKTISRQERENIKLKEKFESISKEYAKYKKDAVGALTQALEKQNTIKKDLESKIVELMNEKNVIKEEIDEEKRKNKTLLIEIQDQTNKLKSLEERYNSLKAVKEELNEKLKHTTTRVKRFEKYMKMALGEK